MPEKLRAGEGAGGQPPRKEGVLIAEATLQANEIQDLADQVPSLLQETVGHELTFHVRVQFGGETPPDATKVDAVNALLAQVTEQLKLR